MVHLPKHLQYFQYTFNHSLFHYPNDPNVNTVHSACFSWIFENHPAEYNYLKSYPLVPFWGWTQIHRVFNMDTWMPMPPFENCLVRGVMSHLYTLPERHMVQKSWPGLVGKTCSEWTILTFFISLGIQSPCQRMIGMSNHLLSKVFRFHCHSQKVIGSLGYQPVGQLSSINNIIR